MGKQSNMATLPPALLRAITSYGVACAKEAEERSRQEAAGLLGFIADIRAAVGDQDGRLMQDELLARIGALAAPAPDTDAQARDFATSLLPKPRKLWGTAHDVDKRPALYTEADALAYGQQMYRLGRQHGRQDDREARRAAAAQKIHDDEAAWSDWRRGAGPKPGGTR